MSKSKIVPNIDTNGYNFDYRVVRCPRKYKGKPVMWNGKPEYYLAIYEIHFGAEGEIVARLQTPENARVCDDEEFGGGISDLKDELQEYLEACNKPILDLDFIDDQIKRSKRRMMRRIRKGKEPESHMESAMKAVEEIKNGTAKLIPWEEVKKELGIDDVPS